MHKIACTIDPYCEIVCSECDQKEKCIIQNTIRFTKTSIDTLYPRGNKNTIDLIKEIKYKRNKYECITEELFDEISYFGKQHGVYMHYMIGRNSVCRYIKKQQKLFISAQYVEKVLSKYDFDMDLLKNNFKKIFVKNFNMGVTDIEINYDRFRKRLFKDKVSYVSDIHPR